MYDRCVDLGDARRYLYRAEWQSFPDVLIFASEPQVKRHPHYAAAKVGDARSASALVEDILATTGLEAVRSLIAQFKPRLLAVHALESVGMNAIPRVLANRLSKELGLPLESGVSQLNRVTHTGKSGYHRLAFPAVFDGSPRAADYLLVDDFIGQGGTIANLRGHVHSLGGTVVGALALAGKHYSSKLQLQGETLQRLRGKHGNQLEEWWISTFGYGFDRLTESEALYLFRSDSFDVITTRLATARGAGD
jgi:predicted amidophosphoribosyltransferase